MQGVSIRILQGPMASLSKYIPKLACLLSNTKENMAQDAYMRKLFSLLLLLIT